VDNIESTNNENVETFLTDSDSSKENLYVMDGEGKKAMYSRIPVSIQDTLIISLGDSGAFIAIKICCRSPPGTLLILR